MDKNRNHTPRNYLRTLALITLVSFISTSILPAQSFATTGIAALFGEPASRDLSASTQLWKTRVPVEFGKVDETFFQTPGVPSRSTVIFIQDAHDSLEAQENIARMVTHLVRNYGVKTVFEEGYEGKVPTDEFFGFIKDPTLKEKTSAFFMDKLRVGGAEYAHINRYSEAISDKRQAVGKDEGRSEPSAYPLPLTADFELIGADSLALHKKGLQDYRESEKSRVAIGKDLSALEQELKDLISARFPKEFKKWMKEKERFAQGQISPVDYLARSVEYAKPETLESLAQVRKLMELFAAEKSQEKSLGEKSAQPALDGMDLLELFREMDVLEEGITRAWLKTEEDQQILHFHQNILLLKKLSEVKVSDAEFGMLESRLAALTTRKIGEGIAKAAGKPLVLSKRWETRIQTALDFYKTARLRDGAIERSLEQYFSEESDKRKAISKNEAQGALTAERLPLTTGTRIAVLVYGGFHKDNIKRILKEKGIDYVILSPKITARSPKHEAFYKRLMTVGYHEFEAPLALRTGSRPLPLVAMGATGMAEVHTAYDQIVARETSGSLLRELTANPSRHSAEMRLPAIHDHPVSFLQDPDFSGFVEQMLQERYSGWGLPRELAPKILNTLRRNANDPEEARRQVYGTVIDFSEDTSWKQAYAGYKAGQKYDAAFLYMETFLRDLPDGACLVDVGAGGNEFGKVIAEKMPGMKVIGIDPYVDPKGYKNPYESTHPNLEFLPQVDREGKPDPLHFPREITSGSVDVVTMNAALHHVNPENVPLLMKEIARILKPGGRFILVEDTYSLDVPAEEGSDVAITAAFLDLAKRKGSGFAKRYFAFNDWYANILVHKWDGMNMAYNFHSIEEWQAILQPFGFNPVGVRHIGFPAGGFHKPDIGIMSFQWSPARAEMRVMDLAATEKLREAGQSGYAAKTARELLTILTQGPTEEKAAIAEWFQDLFRAGNTGREGVEFFSRSLAEDAPNTELFFAEVLTLILKDKGLLKDQSLSDGAAHDIYLASTSANKKKLLHDMFGRAAINVPPQDSNREPDPKAGEPRTQVAAVAILKTLSSFFEDIAKPVEGPEAQRRIADWKRNLTWVGGDTLLFLPSKDPLKSSPTKIGKPINMDEGKGMPVKAVHAMIQGKTVDAVSSALFVTVRKGKVQVQVLMDKAAVTLKPAKGSLNPSDRAFLEEIGKPVPLSTGLKEYWDAYGSDEAKHRGQAGGIGIQEQEIFPLVESVTGDPYVIWGFPVRLTASQLKAPGIQATFPQDDPTWSHPYIQKKMVLESVSHQRSEMREKDSSKLTNYFEGAGKPSFTFRNLLEAMQQDTSASAREKIYEQFIAYLKEDNGRPSAELISRSFENSPRNTEEFLAKMISHLVALKREKPEGTNEPVPLQVYLASESPQRQELVEEMFGSYIPVGNKIDIPEPFATGAEKDEDSDSRVIAIAVRKTFLALVEKKVAQPELFNLNSNQLWLGGATRLFVEGEPHKPIAKPEHGDVVAMHQRIQGKSLKAVSAAVSFHIPRLEDEKKEGDEGGVEVHLLVDTAKLRLKGGQKEKLTEADKEYLLSKHLTLGESYREDLRHCDNFEEYWELYGENNIEAHQEQSGGFGIQDDEFLPLVKDVTGDPHVIMGFPVDAALPWLGMYIHGKGISKIRDRWDISPESDRIHRVGDSFTDRFENILISNKREERMPEAEKARRKETELKERKRLVEELLSNLRGRPRLAAVTLWKMREQGLTRRSSGELYVETLGAYLESDQYQKEGEYILQLMVQLERSKRPAHAANQETKDRERIDIVTGSDYRFQNFKYMVQDFLEGPKVKVLGGKTEDAARKDTYFEQFTHGEMVSGVHHKGMMMVVVFEKLWEPLVNRQREESGKWSAAVETRVFVQDPRKSEGGREYLQDSGTAQEKTELLQRHNNQEIEASSMIGIAEFDSGAIKFGYGLALLTMRRENDALRGTDTLSGDERILFKDAIKAMGQPGRQKKTSLSAERLEQIKSNLNTGGDVTVKDVRDFLNGSYYKSAGGLNLQEPLFWVTVERLDGDPLGATVFPWEDTLDILKQFGVKGTYPSTPFQDQKMFKEMTLQVLRDPHDPKIKKAEPLSSKPLKDPNDSKMEKIEYIPTRQLEDIKKKKDFYGPKRLKVLDELTKVEYSIDPKAPVNFKNLKADPNYKAIALIMKAIRYSVQTIEFRDILRRIHELHETYFLPGKFVSKLLDEKSGLSKAERLHWKVLDLVVRYIIQNYDINKKNYEKSSRFLKGKSGFLGEKEGPVSDKLLDLNVCKLSNQIYLFSLFDLMLNVWNRWNPEGKTLRERLLKRNVSLEALEGEPQENSPDFNQGRFSKDAEGRKIYKMDQNADEKIWRMHRALQELLSQLEKFKDKLAPENLTDPQAIWKKYPDLIESIIGSDFKEDFIFRNMLRLQEGAFISDERDEQVKSFEEARRAQRAQKSVFAASDFSIKILEASFGRGNPLLDEESLVALEKIKREFEPFRNVGKEDREKAERKAKEAVAEALNQFLKRGMSLENYRKIQERAEAWKLDDESRALLAEAVTSGATMDPTQKERLNRRLLDQTLPEIPKLTPVSVSVFFNNAGTESWLNLWRVFLLLKLGFEVEIVAAEAPTLNKDVTGLDLFVMIPYMDALIRKVYPDEPIKTYLADAFSGKRLKIKEVRIDSPAGEDSGKSFLKRIEADLEQRMESEKKLESTGVWEFKERIRRNMVALLRQHHFNILTGTLWYEFYAGMGRLLTDPLNAKPPKDMENKKRNKEEQDAEEKENDARYLGTKAKADLGENWGISAGSQVPNFEQPVTVTKLDAEGKPVLEFQKDKKGHVFAEFAHKNVRQLLDIFVPAGKFGRKKGGSADSTQGYGGSVVHHYFPAEWRRCESAFYYDSDVDLETVISEDENFLESLLGKFSEAGKFYFGNDEDVMSPDVIDVTDDPALKGDKAVHRAVDFIYRTPTRAVRVRVITYEGKPTFLVQRKNDAGNYEKHGIQANGRVEISVGVNFEYLAKDAKKNNDEDNLATRVEAWPNLQYKIPGLFRRHLRRAFKKNLDEKALRKAKETGGKISSGAEGNQGKTIFGGKFRVIHTTDRSVVEEKIVKSSDLKLIREAGGSVKRCDVGLKKNTDFVHMKIVLDAKNSNSILDVRELLRRFKASQNGEEPVLLLAQTVKQWSHTEEDPGMGNLYEYVPAWIEEEMIKNRMETILNFTIPNLPARTDIIDLRVISSSADAKQPLLLPVMKKGARIQLKKEDSQEVDQLPENKKTLYQENCEKIRNGRAWSQGAIPRVMVAPLDYLTQPDDRRTYQLAAAGRVLTVSDLLRLGSLFDGEDDPYWMDYQDYTSGVARFGISDQEAHAVIQLAGPHDLIEGNKAFGTVGGDEKDKEAQILHSFKTAAALAVKNGAMALDLNMGCPALKNAGGGSELLKGKDKKRYLAAKIIEAVREGAHEALEEELGKGYFEKEGKGFKFPVSVKTRLAESQNVKKGEKPSFDQAAMEEFLRAIVEADVSWIVIHTRMPWQQFNFAGEMPENRRKFVNTVLALQKPKDGKMPVKFPHIFVNGNTGTQQAWDDIKRYSDETGGVIYGVAIGRPIAEGKNMEVLRDAVEAFGEGSAGDRTLSFSARKKIIYANLEFLQQGRGDKFCWEKTMRPSVTKMFESLFKNIPEKEVYGEAKRGIEEAEDYASCKKVLNAFFEKFNIEGQIKQSLGGPVDIRTDGASRSEMRQAGPVKAVVFDIGNVFVSFDPQKAVQAILAAGARAVWTPEAIVDLLYRTAPYKNFEINVLSAEEFAAVVCGVLGIPSMTFARFQEIYSDVFTEIPGMVALAERLKTAGYKVFFLSDTNKLHMDYLQSYGFMGIPDRIFTSCGLRLRKEDGSRVFEAMGRAVKQEYPEIELANMLFIDDRKDNVEAGEQAGVPGHIFTSVRAVEKALLERGVVLPATHSEMRAAQFEALKASVLSGWEGLDALNRTYNDPELKAAVDELHHYKLAEALARLARYPTKDDGKQAVLKQLVADFPPEEYSVAKGWSGVAVDLEEQTSLFRAIEHAITALSDWGREEVAADPSVPDFWAGDPHYFHKKKLFTDGIDHLQKTLAEVFPEGNIAAGLAWDKKVKAMIPVILHGNKTGDLSRRQEAQSSGDRYLVDHRSALLKLVKDKGTKNIAFVLDNLGGETFSVILTAWLLIQMGKNVTIYGKQDPMLLSDTTLPDLKYSVTVFDRILQGYFGVAKAPLLAQVLQSGALFLKAVPDRYVYTGERGEGHKILSPSFDQLGVYDAAVIMGELQYGDFMRRQLRRVYGTAAGSATRPATPLNPFSATSLVFLKANKNIREVNVAVEAPGYKSGDTTRGEYIVQAISPVRSEMRDSDLGQVLTAVDDPSETVRGRAINALVLFMQTDKTYATPENLGKIIDALRDPYNIVYMPAGKAIQFSLHPNDIVFTPENNEKMLAALNAPTRESRYMAMTTLPSLIKLNHAYATESILQYVLSVMEDPGASDPGSPLLHAAYGALDALIQVNPAYATEANLGEVLESLVHHPSDVSFAAMRTVEVFSEVNPEAFTAKNLKKALGTRYYIGAHAKPFLLQSFVQVNKAAFTQVNFNMVLEALRDDRVLRWSSEVGMDREAALAAIPYFIEANRSHATASNLAKIMCVLEDPDAAVRATGIDVFSEFIQANGSLATEPNLAKVLALLRDCYKYGSWGFQRFETGGYVDEVPYFVQGNKTYATVEALRKNPEFLGDAQKYNEWRWTRDIRSAAFNALSNFVESNPERATPQNLEMILAALGDSEVYVRITALGALSAFVRANKGYATKMNYTKVLDAFKSSKDNGQYAADHILYAVFAALSAFFEANKDYATEKNFEMILTVLRHSQMMSQEFKYAACRAMLVYLARAALERSEEYPFARVAAGFISAEEGVPDAISSSTDLINMNTPGLHEHAEMNLLLKVLDRLSTTVSEGEERSRYLRLLGQIRTLIRTNKLNDPKAGGLDLLDEALGITGRFKELGIKNPFKDGTLYVTLLPCKNCQAVLQRLELKEIVYDETHYVPATANKWLLQLRFTFPGYFRFGAGDLMMGAMKDELGLDKSDISAFVTKEELGVTPKSLHEISDVELEKRLIEVLNAKLEQQYENQLKLGRKFTTITRIESGTRLHPNESWSHMSPLGHDRFQSEWALAVKEDPSFEAIAQDVLTRNKHRKLGIVAFLGATSESEMKLFFSLLYKRSSSKTGLSLLKNYEGPKLGYFDYLHALHETTSDHDVKVAVEEALAKLAVSGNDAPAEPVFLQGSPAPKRSEMRKELLAEKVVSETNRPEKAEVDAIGVPLLKEVVVFSIEAGDLAELKNWPELLATASFNPRKLFMAVTGSANAISEARIKELSQYVTVLRDEQLSTLPKTAPVFHFGNMTENAAEVRARISTKLGRDLKALLGIASGSFFLPALLLDEQVQDAALSNRGGFLFDDGRFTGRYLEVLFRSIEVISAAA